MELNLEPVQNKSESIHDKTDSFEEARHHGDYIEDMIRNTGPNFRFQIVLLLCMFYMVLTTGLHFVLSMFTGNEPSWTCATNSSNEFCRTNYDKHIHSYDAAFSQKCRMNRSEWQFTSMKDYSFVTEFDLVCEKTYLAAMVSASFYMGGFLGTTLSGTIGDIFGRKPVLFYSALLLISSTIGCGFIKNIWQLVTINILRGAAAVANYYTIFVYSSEFVPSSWRTFSSGLMLFAGPTSFLLLDLVAYTTKDWRRTQLYSGFMPLLGLFIFAFLPESPRWLLSKKKHTEATSVLETIMKFNGNTERRVTLPKSTSLSSSSRDKKYTYTDLVRNIEVLKITCCVSILWFAVTLVFYVIALQSSSLGANMYKTFALSTLADHCASIASIFLLYRIGRKPTILGGLFVSGLLMGSLLLIPKSVSSRDIINLVISSIARFSACTAFDGMFTWTIELFPTVVRSQGMSVSVIFERLGMFCCPFITRVLHNISPNLPLIIMCVLAILATIIGLVLPETKNMPTREKYEDFFSYKSRDCNNSIGIENEVDLEG